MEDMDEDDAAWHVAAAGTERAALLGAAGTERAALLGTAEPAGGCFTEGRVADAAWGGAPAGTRGWAIGRLDPGAVATLAALPATSEGGTDATF